MNTIISRHEYYVVHDCTRKLLESNFLLKRTNVLRTGLAISHNVPGFYFYFIFFIYLSHSTALLDAHNFPKLCSIYFASIGVMPICFFITHVHTFTGKS